MGNNLTTHSIEDAFRTGVRTWASWMERNLDPETSQVFFRSFAPVHFRYVYIVNLPPLDLGISLA